MGSNIMNKKSAVARELFLSGANCAQAVLGAFAEECGLDLESALRMASGFGGGFARMREVCGTVSGMYLVMNLLYGYSDLQDKKVKDLHYCRLRRLSDLFQKETSSVICRDLLSLGKGQEDSPESSERTSQYYQKRPCADLAALAASIAEREIRAMKQKDLLSFSAARGDQVPEVTALWNSLRERPIVSGMNFIPRRRRRRAIFPAAFYIVCVLRMALSPPPERSGIWRNTIPLPPGREKIPAIFCGSGWILFIREKGWLPVS